VTPAAGAALDYLVEAFGLAVPDRVLAELAAVRPTPRERFAHLVAGSAPPHGAGIVKLWDRYRRLRTFDHECPRPNGFLEMLADHWELPRRRDLVPQLARRAVKIGARSQSQA
jgi:hypothetical protein